MEIKGQNDRTFYDFAWFCNKIWVPSDILILFRLPWPNNPLRVMEANNKMSKDAINTYTKKLKLVLITYLQENWAILKVLKTANL